MVCNDHTDETVQYLFFLFLSSPPKEQALCSHVSVGLLCPHSPQIPQSPELRYMLSLHVVWGQHQQFGLAAGFKTLAHRSQVTAACALIKEHMEQAVPSVRPSFGALASGGEPRFPDPSFTWQVVFSIAGLGMPWEGDGGAAGIL